MHPNDSDTGLHFPGRLVFLAAAVSVACCGWLAWSSYQAFSTLERTTIRIAELERLRGQILHYDEVLTMSGRMAAATGDSRWIERYERFEPQLKQVIARAERLADSPKISRGIAATEHANLDLVMMERHAFNLVHAGREELAQKLLAGPAYERAKADYADGMDTALTAFREVIGDINAQRRNELTGALFLAVVMVAVILILWWLVSRRLRHWRRVLATNQARRVTAELQTRSLNAELEDRVAARTAELQQSQTRLKTLVDNSPIVFFALDADGRFTLSEGAALSRLGLQPGEVVGRSVFEVYTDQPDIQDHAKRALAGESVSELVTLGDLTYLTNYKPLPDTGNGVSAVIGVATDISERYAAERRADSLAQAVAQSPTAIALIAADGEIAYVNSRLETIIGLTADQVLGQDWRILRPGGASVRQTQHLRQIFSEGQQWSGEFNFRRQDGASLWLNVTLSPIRDSEGAISQYMYTAQDISARKRSEQQLSYRTYFDSLTGMPNLVLARERIEEVLARAQVQKERCGILLVDMDRFNKINDTLGRRIGDRVVAEVAQRIRAATPAADSVARIGGDDFLVLASRLEQNESAALLADRIIKSLSKPYVIDGQELFITASAGITVCPDDGGDTDSLLANAEIALYGAKAAGRNTYHFFQSEMGERAQRRMLVEQELRHALERGELSLQFQPIIELGSNAAIGGEALLRWHSKQLGPVPPDEFIPVAEDIGLIESIGEWVLREACRHAHTWREQDARPLRIGVNVSSRQFALSDFGKRVLDILQETNTEPEQLTIEVTESLLIQDPPEVAHNLNLLSEQGINLAIDDFGTGYSSLGYLKHFPFDILKIDKIFVRDLAQNSSDAELAAGIVALGHNLGMRVVGEGVETAEQLAFLERQGCNLVQGYYFSKPLPPAEFVDWVRRYNGAERDASAPGAG